MRLAVEATVPGLTSVAGVMEADGELEYHPETGRFTIAKGRLVDLELQGMPKQQMKLFEELAQAVVTKQLSSLTVYQFDQEDFKQSLAKLAAPQKRAGHAVEDHPENLVYDESSRPDDRSRHPQLQLDAFWGLDMPNGIESAGHR